MSAKQERQIKLLIIVDVLLKKGSSAFIDTFKEDINVFKFLSNKTI